MAFGCHNDFLHMTSKLQASKAKIDKWNKITLKASCGKLCNQEKATYTMGNHIYKSYSH